MCILISLEIIENFDLHQNWNPIIKRMAVQKEEEVSMWRVQRRPGAWTTEKMAAYVCLGAARNRCGSRVGYAWGGGDVIHEARGC